MNIQNTKSKVKKPIVGMAFRLLDFDIYDGSIQELENGSSSESGSGSGSGSSGEEFYDDEDNEYPTIRNFKKGNEPKDPQQFIVQMFGLNDKGKTCCLYVTDYKPFFYARVGNTWTQSTVNSFVNDVITQIGKYNQAGLETAFIEEHHALYGFSAGNKHKFVKFVFKNSYWVKNNI